MLEIQIQRAQTVFNPTPGTLIVPTKHRGTEEFSTASQIQGTSKKKVNWAPGQCKVKGKVNGVYFSASNILSLFIVCIWRDRKGKAFKCRKMKVNSVIWSKDLNNSIELSNCNGFSGSRTFANCSWIYIFTILTASNSSFGREFYDPVKGAL